MKNRVDVARVGDIVFMRVVGLGNAMIAVSLRDLLDVYIQHGIQHIVVDCAECTGLDSTFMGTLIALASEIGETQTANSESSATSLPPMVLANVSNVVYKQLDTLGLTGMKLMIHIKTEPVEFPQSELKHIEEQPVDKKKRLKQIISAHKELMKINDKNEEIFGTFLKAIISEIKKEDD